MAVIKITDLSELVGSSLAPEADVLEIVNGGANKKIKASSLLGPTPPSVTGTTYTFALADAFRTVVFDSSSAQTITIPTNASVAYPIGTRIRCFRKGTGTVKVTPDTGVTLNLPTGIKPKRTMGTRVKLSGNLTGINASSVYTIGWDTEVWDTDGFHDNVTNNSRLTVPSGLGIKKISASASLLMSSLSTNTLATLGIQKNGSAVYDGFTQSFGPSTGIVTSEISAASGEVSVTDGDYFTVITYTPDTSTTLSAGQTGASLTVTEIDAQGWIAYQYGSIEIQKIDTNEWIVIDQTALG